MSTSKQTIHEALNSVMLDVSGVAKRERNQAQGFNFRGIDAVVNAVGPAFRAHGVIAVPEVIKAETSSVPLNSGKSATRVSLIVLYRFYGQTGDFIEATVAAEAFDSGDKATAKAMSVAFRTALLQVLALPTDERDPDHDIYEAVTITKPDPAVADLKTALAQRFEKADDRKKFLEELTGRTLKGVADLTPEEATQASLALQEKEETNA